MFLLYEVNQWNKTPTYGWTLVGSVSNQTYKITEFIENENWTNHKKGITKGKWS